MTKIQKSEVNGDQVEADIELLRRLIAEALAPYIDTIDRLEVDMWRGKDNDNPSVVTRLVGLEGNVSGIRRDWFGNGKPGLRDTLVEFMTESKTREKEREKQIASQQQEVKTSLNEHNAKMTRRYNWLMAIIAVFALLIAWLTYVDTHNAVKTGTLKLPQFPAASRSDPPQDAKKEKLFAY